MFAGLATGPFSPQFGRFLAYFLVFLGISVLLSLSKDSVDPEFRDSHSEFSDLSRPDSDPGP